MMIVTCIRRFIYPAALVLLLIPLMIAVGSPARASAAPTSAPVATYTGADAYSNPTWATADTSGNPNYLGNLKSQKFFYNYNTKKNEIGIPSSASATTYEYNIPGCKAKSSTSKKFIYPTGTLCIIVWNYGGSTDGSDLKNFLMSTKSDTAHRYLMVFCNEVEIHVNSTSGCECDSAGAIGFCGNSANFETQFEAYSKYIANFESENGVSNVRMAEISAATYYSQSFYTCGFIVPQTEVSSYLVDVYEKDAKGNPLSDDPGWNHWKSCTPASATLGIAEYGIDCSHESKTGPTTTATFKADEKYLRPLHLLVWNIWDYGGCVISTQHELKAVDAWRNITGA